MTTPLVLAPLPPPSDAVSRPDIDDADCTLTRNVVCVALTTLGPSSESGSDTSTTPTDDGDADAPGPDAQTNRTRQWTGAPLRAIVPLPRRKLASASANGSAREAPVPSWTRACQWEDASESDSEDEHVQSESLDGDDAPLGPRCCSYESITAAEGLSSYSFEELRVECYAQSRIARGIRPPPVVQPSLAIPPAFTPTIVSRH